MKKYVFLTSVLALAACGGGGGHGGGAVTSIEVPAELGGRVSSSAATSNQEITQMKSEVIVSSNSDTELSRSAQKTVDGVRFVSYRLEDIKLFAADSVNTDQGFLQIGMNENTGRIENITMEVGGVGAPVARVGNTNQFNAPIFEYVQDDYAEVNGDVFFVVDNAGADAALRSAIASAYNFAPGTWEQQGSGEWKYKRTSDGQYEIINGNDFVVDDDRDSLLEAVKDANNFDDGKWVTESGNIKYIEYGDRAVFRTVDTGQTMAQLEDLADAKSLSGGHWNRIDEVMDVVTYGSDIGNGQSLQYADFGHFNPVYKTKDVDLTGKTGDDWDAEIAKSHTALEVDNELAEEDYQLFAGGYAIKGIALRDTLSTPKDTTFKGMAIGRVYVSMDGVTAGQLASYGVTSGDGHDIAKMFKTQDATLTIDANGKQTLYMPFNSKAMGDKYYDVTLVKNANGTIATPQFTGNESQIGSQYRKYDAMDHIVDNQSSLNMGYYGVNTATEAAGTARLYSEKDLGGGATREYEVQAAWGMKKQ